jgi:hypothetical protein
MRSYDGGGEDIEGAVDGIKRRAGEVTESGLEVADFEGEGVLGERGD